MPSIFDIVGSRGTIRLKSADPMAPPRATQRTTGITASPCP